MATIDNCTGVKMSVTKNPFSSKINISTNTVSCPHVKIAFYLLTWMRIENQSHKDIKINFQTIHQRLITKSQECQVVNLLSESESESESEF